MRAAAPEPQGRAARRPQRARRATGRRAGQPEQGAPGSHGSRLPGVGGGRRRLRARVARHFRRVPGWPDDVAESEEEAERRRGAGEARERAVTAAARRSQRLGPGPVRLSAPRGCESAAAEAAAAEEAAAEEEESVRRRRAGGSAEDEAAAGRSRRGGGRRAVAAAAAPGPGGRARAHGESLPRPEWPPPHPRPARRPVRLGAAWRAGRPRRSPAAAEDAFRLGLAEQKPRELGGGVCGRSRGRTPLPSAWASLSNPHLNGATLEGLGAGGPGRDRGGGRRSLPRGGAAAAGRRARGWCPRGRELRSGYWGLRHSGRWMHHDYPSYTNQEISAAPWSSLAFIFSPAQT